MAQIIVDSETAGRYVLATGEHGERRLEILHTLYGPGTRDVLERAGIRRGMRVADFGCGVGTVTLLMAEAVGPEGHVVGVDASGEQIARARERVGAAGSQNVSFAVASATDTGLPRGTFDLVYCRFLLLHLADPAACLREMYGLLRPGGVIVCEDGDLTSAGSEPPSVLDAFAELFGRLGPTRGLDYTLGRRLYHMVAEAGFVSPSVRFNQPVRARGEEKRMLEWSVAEAADAFVGAGLVPADALAASLAEMERLADDDRVLAVMPRMSQVWATKA